MSYIEVVRIHDPFPECGKESIIFIINCAWEDEIFNVTQSLIEFLNICWKYEINPDIELYSDIIEGSRHIRVSVRENEDKIKDIHIDWDKYANSEKG